MLLATVFCCSPLYAQFGAFATWARQKEAPAQITAMEGLGAWAKIKNTSNETITDVQLASVLEMLCTDKPTSPSVKINRIAHINLKPNATIQIETRPQDNLAANDPVVLQAQKLSAVAKIEFGFVYVKFEDGTSWRYDLKNTGGFGPPNPTEENAICQQVRTGKNQ